MLDARSVRERALQSKDAIELLANKWRITTLYILTEELLLKDRRRGRDERLA